MSAREGHRERVRAQRVPLRILSGVILSVITLGAAWLGGYVFAAVLLVALGLGLGEFFRLAARAGHAVQIMPGLLAGIAVVVLAVSHEAHNLGAVLVVVAFWMIARALRPPSEGRLVGLALTVFGVVYVCGLGIHILWIRELQGGFALLCLVLVGTWAADTFAFFVGLRFGRSPLAPTVSPGKSVEGFLGGLAGATLVLAVAAAVFDTPLGVIPALAVGLVIGVASPLGDLLESLIKRNLHAKDASRVIPGHGGILDRIDSLLAAAPVAYYLFRFLL